MTPRVAGPWGMFRRFRLLCGGQIVEDIDQYGRLHEMCHMMQPSEKREMILVKALGRLM